MDLRKKLARLGVAQAPSGDLAPNLNRHTSATAEIASGADSRSATIDKLRRALASMAPPKARAATHPSSTEAVRALDLERHERPEGPLHARERLLEDGHRHGNAEVRGALRAKSEDLAALALDPKLASVEARSMLLLDTETTGLSGGTGTLPFLVGMAWFEGERLRLSQLVLRRPGEERPILAALAERLAEASFVVTYNGKSFDWPLLRNRCVMNRLRPPEPKPHLDLLHCARRVYRHRVKGARLVQLEAEILGHHRSGDIPGELIPDRYFRFLRTGNGSLLAPVLEHNAQDVILLAALLGVLAREFEDGGRSDGDARVHLGYASVAERAGQWPRALAFGRSAAKSPSAAIRSAALLVCARVFRRRGEDRAAAESFEQAARCAPDAQRPLIHLELAKLLEHRLGALPAALVHARAAAGAEEAGAHRRRLARLERRLACAEGTLPLAG